MGGVTARKLRSRAIPCAAATVSGLIWSDLLFSDMCYLYLRTRIGGRRAVIGKGPIWHTPQAPARGTGRDLLARLNPEPRLGRFGCREKVISVVEAAAFAHLPHTAGTDGEIPQWLAFPPVAGVVREHPLDHRQDRVLPDILRRRRSADK